MKKYKVLAIVGGNELCHQIIMATNKADAIEKVEIDEGIIANLAKDGGRINIVRYTKIHEWFDNSFHPTFRIVGIGIFVGAALGILVSYFN